MAKARSPRYPAISLPDAIDKARLVYKGDHLNKIPKTVVAEHMGYQSLNGKSLGVVSALIKYGLLEGSSESMNITERALAILANDKGSPERAAAILEAAYAPELFSEIRAEYPNGISDQALRSFLLSRKRFLQSAVDGAIRAYRDTVDLVSKEVQEYDSEPETDAQASEAHMETASESKPKPGDFMPSVRKPDPPAQRAEKPIIFDMETVGGTYEFDNADDLADFIAKLEKIKALMPSKH